MRFIARLVPVFFLAGCAAAAQTEFSTAGIGPIPNAVECAAEAIEDEGFTVTHRDDSGILHAERGADRLAVNVVPGDGQTYVIRVETSDSDVARDAAEDIVSECAG